ncbi:MAG TPA: FG-GAP-like repeat-containing protein [Blastocatellia bacterium]|nr:FG-GAP-like repeat-containing protein [Blastocatellia bacterium]
MMNRTRRTSRAMIAVGIILTLMLCGQFAVAPKVKAAGATSNVVAPSVMQQTGCGAGSFAQPAGSPFSAGNRPRSVAISDFNLDGKPDLAVANQGSNVTIRLGDGTGGFPDATSSTVATGDSPYSVAIGDFNLDGKPDLAVANRGSNNVTIRLGNGMGGFPTSSTVGAGAGPTVVAIGDFNLDGKPDLAVANESSNNVTIGLGDGTGGFPTSSTVGAVFRPLSVAIADFNRDGKPDLATANLNSNNVTIRLGNGMGGFPTSSTFDAGDEPYSVAIGDFNLDGKPDLAVANTFSNSVTIRLGNGFGGFPTSSTVSVGDDPYSVAVGDFNLDGKPDLAVAITSSNNVTIRLGDGMGGFPNATSSTVGAGSGPISVAIGDFNLDGKPDLATANFGSNNVTIQLNTCDALPCSGSSFTQPAGSPFVTGNTPISVAVGDFNIDGKPDLAVANRGPRNVSIRLGDGMGGFLDATSSTVGTGSGPLSVAIGDFNLDGKPDLAITNNISNNVTIRLGDGMGGFPDATSSTVGTGNAPISVAVGDFNLDSKPDLAITIDSSGTVTIRLGDGMGGFPDATSSTVGTGSGPFSVAVGDFNLDGKPDLAVANQLSDNVTIRLGDGMGGFPDATSSTIGAGFDPLSVAIGDFNLDGKPDLAIANSRSANVTIRLGDGMGGFPDATSSTVGAGNAPSSVSIGDFNLDGKPDLAVSNFTSDNVTIRLGNGTGGFPDATSSTVGAGSRPKSVAIGDFNLDGKPDLAVTNIFSHNVTIQLNTCTANQSPVADAGAHETVECSGVTTPVTLDGSASADPDNDALTYSWKEGATEIATGANPTVNLASGSHTVTLTVTDPSNESDTDQVTIIVQNAIAPTINSVTATPGLVALGGAVTVTASYSDAVSRAHIAVFSWDDGTANTTVPAAAASSGSIQASHTYAEAGVYSVTVTVSSECGLGSSFTYQYVVVYDPSAGFVTGSGWITSAPGSFLDDPTLTGRATFGFVSKYLRGANVPTGDTEFNFQVGGFRFTSTAYEWMVVSGHKAQYRGSGKVNGADNYGFLLTATDGQLPGGGGTDMFRIKIWDRATNQVVYDNRRGVSDDIDGADPQAIGGGSIVIHR